MEAKKGDRVSLVLSKRAFFFQGIGGLNLGTEGVESAIIPNTVTDEMLNQINMAVGMGHLVIGHIETRVELPNRDGDLKTMLDLGRSKIDEWILKLMSDKTVSKEIKIDLLEKLVSFEIGGKNRKSIIKSAEGAMKTIGGVSPVTETEKEKIEIKLTSGTEEEKVDK
jgi:hypothetical protein